MRGPGDESTTANCGERSRQLIQIQIHHEHGVFEMQFLRTMSTMSHASFEDRTVSGRLHAHVRILTRIELLRHTQAADASILVKAPAPVAPQ